MPGPYTDRSCIHEVGRGTEHYEWRLPEPMTRSHMKQFSRFLELLAEGKPNRAAKFVRELTGDANTNITAFERAKAVGVNNVARSSSRFDETNNTARLENWFRNKVHVEMA